MDHRVEIGMTLDRGKLGLHCPEELQTEARGLPLVPEQGLGQISLRSTLEAEFRHLPEAVEQAAPDLGPWGGGCRVHVKGS